MDEGRAREILRTVANGIDPVTGEILPDESPCEKPMVIRALFLMIHAANQRSQPPKSKKLARLIEIEAAREPPSRQAEKRSVTMERGFPGGARL